MSDARFPDARTTGTVDETAERNSGTRPSRAVWLLVLALLLALPAWAQEAENSPATGKPVITGTLRQAFTLTADTSGIADADGISTSAFRYQWFRVDGDRETLIFRARRSTYRLTFNDEGKRVKVRVTFDDTAGNEEVLDSDPSGEVGTGTIVAPAGNLRLRGGASKREGRVEVFIEGAWGAVCYIGFNEDAGDVACRQLGFLGLDGRHRLETPVAGQGNVQSFLMGYLNCTGSESRLVDCDYSYPSRRTEGHCHFNFRDLNIENEALSIRCTSTRHAAVGAPTISGTLQVEGTLSADVSGITDANGMDNAIFTYQWLADDAAISGATRSTYTLKREEQGKQIKVRVSFTDDHGYDETLTTAASSGATVPYLPGILVNAKLGAATLTVDEGGSGTYTVRLGTLPAGSGTATVTVSGTSGTDVSATPSSLTFTTGDWSVAQTVTVSAAHDDDHQNDTVTLTHTASGGSYTVDTVDVVVTVADDETGLLRLRDGLTRRDGRLEIFLNGEWGLVCDDGFGQDEGDVACRELGFVRLHHFIAVLDLVTGSGDLSDIWIDDVSCEGSENRLIRCNYNLAPNCYDGESIALVCETINVGAAGVPTISGTLQVDGTLSADVSGVTDANGLTGVTFKYQWLADDAPISGATASTYTLTREEPGKQIKVRVRFTDNEGHQEALTSAAASSGATVPFVPAILVGAATLELDEGGSDTYTVQLATLPAGTVTVTVSGTSGTDLSATPSSLTYATGNWSTARTVTVDAAHDDDRTVDTVTLTHTASGGSYTVDPVDVVVTVDDDDSTAPSAPGLTATSEDNGHIIHLAWTAPDDGGRPVTAQLIEVSPDLATWTELHLDASNVDVDSAESTLRHSRLNENTTYYYRISATNEIGTSGFTEANAHTGASLVCNRQFRWRLMRTIESRDLTDARTLELCKDVTATRLAGVEEWEIRGVAESVFLESADFAGLTGLKKLTLDNVTRLEGMSGDVFSEVQGLRELVFDLVSVEVLPAGLFVGLTSLTKFQLLDLPFYQDPVTLAVSLQKVGEGQFKAVAPTGAPFDIVLPVSVTGGSLEGGATSVTVATGTAESAPVRVVQTSGSTASVEVAIGTLPSLPSDHQGYSLTKPDVALEVVEGTEPLLSIADAEAVESAGLGFVVTLSGASNVDVTVDWTTADGTAAADADYTAASGTLTFAAGATARTITVAVTDDAMDELDETFQVRLSNLSNAVLATGETPDTATGTIRDNDDSPLFLIADAVGREDGGSLGFVVTLDAASARVTMVDWQTVDDSAVSPADYTAASGTLTFAAGVTARTITVAVTDDGVDEEDERFGVELSRASNAWVDESRARGWGTIKDTDATPGLSITDAGGREDAGSLEFVVTLDAASARGVTVDWATADDSAVSPADYTAASGTLTFAAGVTARTITVAVTDDAVDEEDTERFRIVLSTALNAALDDTGAEGTIEDDDALPELSIADAGGMEDAGSLEFVVTLDAASGRGVTVDWATADDGAVSPADYTAGSGTLTFAAGVTAQAITVAVTDDAVDEEDTERFRIALSGALNARFAGGVGTLSATGTIQDNDALPGLSIADAGGGEDAGSLAFVVSLSAASGREATVSWQTVDDSAESPADYTAGSGKLTFAAGVTAQTITVAVADDAVDEEDEGFGVELSSPSNAALDGVAAEGTIQDDDSRGIVISTPTLTVAEGGSGNYTVVLESAPTATVTIRPVLDPDRTDAGVTVQFEPQVLTFTGSDWNVLQTVMVSPAEDANAVDNDARVTHGVSGGDYAGEEAAAVAVRITETTLPELRFAALNVSGAESVGRLTFGVTLSPVSDRVVTVSWATADGTAAAGADYEAGSGTLTFAAGVTARTITVAVTDDEADEADETFGVTLSEAAGAVLPGGQATVEAIGTITDNDPTPVLSIAAVAGGGEARGRLVFEVRLSAASGREVTVSWATADGTASAGVDYTAGSGTLTFAAGVTARTITVAVTDDALNEPAETLTVSLSRASNAVPAGGAETLSVSATIADDDSTPVLSMADAGGGEDDGGLVFEVRLSAASSREVTVSWATADGTASAGSDYEAGSGTLTFGAGVTTRRVTVTLVSDDFDDADVERFTVRLSNPSNATFSGGGTTLSATGTIEDNDTRAMVLSTRALTIEEGGSGSYTVVLGSAPTAAVAVTIALAGSAAADLEAPAELRFDGSNWAEPQAVQVVANTDTDAHDEEATLTHEASGGDYGELAAVVVTVTVTETAAPPQAESGADVNGDGVIDEDDALAMYYAYAYQSQLGDGEEGGFDESRQALLGGLSGASDPTDEHLKTLLRAANAWRSGALEAGGDVNGDGVIDEDDALVMYYAYAYQSQLGNGDEDGFEESRRALLGGLSGESDPTDEDLRAMLRAANALRGAV